MQWFFSVMNWGVGSRNVVLLVLVFQGMHALDCWLWDLWAETPDSLPICLSSPFPG